MPGKFTFFSTAIQGDQVLFDENETRHAIGTLRFKTGDPIEFTDGIGNYYFATISSVEKRFFSAFIIKKENRKRSEILTIACGIIKSTDRMEWMVEKCTEMGIAKILFFDGQNSERNKLNIERLNKIAVGAIKQSHGAWLPQIELVKWKDILTSEAPNKWIAKVDSETPASPLQFKHNGEDHILLIGPEGDFSDREFSESLAVGFKPVTLGNNVLRTETAVMAAAAAFYLSIN